MDMSRVHQPKSNILKKGRRKMSNNDKKSVKVVYISTPVKVNISASNFRALVQELTGRDSDMSRFEDFNHDLSDKSLECKDDIFRNFGEKSWELKNDQTNSSEKSWELKNDQVTTVSSISNYSANDTDHENSEGVVRPVIHEFQAVAMMEDPCYYDYSPASASSESLLDSFDDVVSSRIVEELEQMFPSNLFDYGSCISHENHVLGDVYGRNRKEKVKFRCYFESRLRIVGFIE
ncbi:Sigma factor binding protein 1 [Heracleum sosnowskyi]|uniref:Sigma factor binding protein 1 n=1 Tax=Heracleum sosnowskyi TaxID=360622 RepID=A0AAD8LWD8_9APIA|nr:Sigma factor binding protein 1 [Heracleum sosnowskyi]